MDSLRERTYATFQGAGDSQGRMRTFLRSQYLRTVSQDAIATIVEHIERAPSAGATVFVSPRSDAETDPAPDETAYAHRDDAHHCLIETRWDEPARDDEHVGWTRAFHDAMRPYATGDVAMNFLTRDENDRRIGAAYGDNYDRLVAVKDEWDPENRFGGSHHLDPSG